MKKRILSFVAILGLGLFFTVSTQKTSGLTASTEPIQVSKSYKTMYRLYNPNSGEHFYTSDTNEVASLNRVGWKSEGIGWLAPKTGAPVYRMYNANAGDHHYTLSTFEKDSLIKAGWKYEGIGWYSGGTQQILRAYNPNAKAGAHNYTSSQSEQNSLLKAGWRNEGNAWKGVIPKTKQVEVYRGIGAGTFGSGEGGPGPWAQIDSSMVTIETGSKQYMYLPTYKGKKPTTIGFLYTTPDGGVGVTGAIPLKTGESWSWERWDNVKAVKIGYDK
jgi:hypothetical protein